MANELTGDFDAVAQVRTSVLNGLLGTVHANGGLPNASPTFMHSAVVRVGPGPDSKGKLPWQSLEVAVKVFMGLAAHPEDVSKFIGEFQRSPVAAIERVAGVSREQAQQALTILESAISPGLIIPVRGTAQVQLSSPTISFLDGVTSELTAHCDARVRYTPDPGTLPLPEIMHGEIRAAFSIELQPWGNAGDATLEATLTDDDTKIAFLPAAGSGMTPDIAKIVTREVRRFLRESVEPANVELTAGFAFHQFRALGSGPGQVIALPVMLPGGGPSGGSLNSVNSNFLGASDEFGIAISRAFVDPQFGPTLNKLLAFTDTITVVKEEVPVVTPLGFWIETIEVTYQIGVSSAVIEWHPGYLEVTVKGSATTSSILLSDYSFTIKQKLKLALIGQVLTVQADGPPTIDGLNGLPSGTVSEAKTLIASKTGAALAGAQSAVGALSDSVSLNKALGQFGATSKLTSVAVAPGGVILRGDVIMVPKPPVVVEYAETGDGTRLTAFRSWVPGGGITSFRWTWASIDFGVPLPGAFLSKEVTEEHTFLLPKPADLPPYHQVCLQVNGKGTVCGVAGPQPEILVAIGPWFEDILPIPIWGAEIGPDGVGRMGVVAHANAVAGARMKEQASVNSVVHFTAGESVAVLRVLAEAAGRRQRRDAQVSIVVVLPAGTLSRMAATAYGEVARMSGTFNGTLTVTEDYDGRWTRAFGVEQRPATHLLSARREVAWQDGGPLDGARLAAALDAHAVVGRAIWSRPLDLALRTREPAPDFLFEYVPDRRKALRKLRGRRVTLVFWSAWSAPALAELRRLERVVDAGGEPQAVVLAIGDGVTPSQLQQIRREHSLTMTLVPDPDRRISRQYRINCWPTRLSVDDRGMIVSRHFGRTPSEAEHGSTPG